MTPKDNAARRAAEIGKAIAQNTLMLSPWVRRYAASRHSTGMDGSVEQARRLLDFYREMAPIDGTTILELGPGKTLETLAFALEAGAAKVIAADVTRYHSDEDARRFNVDYRVFDGRQLPVADGTVDLVWACYCMQHFRQPAQMLKEIHRVLRPGGALVCRVDLRDHYHMFVPGREYDCLRHSKWTWRRMASHRVSYVNRLRLSGWRNLLSRTGFATERLVPHEDEQTLANNRRHAYLAHLDDNDIRTYRFDGVFRP